MSQNNSGESGEGEDLRASVEKFLIDRIQLIEKETTKPLGLSEESFPNEVVQINAILLSGGAEIIRIGHLNELFEVNVSDIVSICDAPQPLPNPFGQGVPVAISIIAESRVISRRAFLAKDLIAGLPFVLSRPSLNKPLSRNPFPPEHDAWLAERGIAEGVAPQRATQKYTNHQSPNSTTRRTTDPNTGSTSVDGVDTDGYTSDGYDPDGFDNDPDNISEGVNYSVSPQRATQKYTPHQSAQKTTRYTTDPKTGSTAVDGYDTDGYSNDGYDPDGFDNDPDNIVEVSENFVTPQRATQKYTPHQCAQKTTRYTKDPKTGSTAVDGYDTDGYTNDGYDRDGFDNDSDSGGRPE